MESALNTLFFILLGFFIGDVLVAWGLGWFSIDGPIADLFPRFRRLKKLRKIFGENVNSKILFQYLQDPETLLLSREELSEILVGIKIQFEHTLGARRIGFNNLCDLLIKPSHSEDIIGHKQAAVVYCLSKGMHGVYAPRNPVTNKKIIGEVKIMEEDDARPVYVPIGADFLPIYDLAVKLPTQEEVLAAAKEMIRKSHSQSTDEGSEQRGASGQE